MRKIRESKLSRLLSIFLCLTLLYSTTSCSTDILLLDEEGNVVNNKNLLSYSGEDIFKGIFFFQNDITEEITSIKNSQSYYFYTTNTTFKGTIDLFSSEIVTKIYDIDENFFNNFKSLITSKNHLKINDAFKMASIKIVEAMPYTSHFNSYDVNIFEGFDIDKYVDDDGNIIDFEEFKHDLDTDYGLGTRGCSFALACVLFIFIISYAAIVQMTAVFWISYLFVVAEKYFAINPKAGGDIIYENVVNEIMEMNL